jgi:hypothetical protein
MPMNLVLTPALNRPSTPSVQNLDPFGFPHRLRDVDGRAKPGHDE